MSHLRVTLIQSSLHWQNAEKNRQMFAQNIEQLKEPTDLIILPEMFTTGFTMEASKFAEPPQGPTLEWMRKIALNKNAHLLGSLIVRQEGLFFNRLFWVTPKGQVFYYDKRHLFRMAGEHKTYHAGNVLLTVQLKGWKIRPFICYDLRFPVWSRNVGLAYDLAIYIANWPERRRHAWRTLLQARAAENQAYVVGVNRIGTDGLGIKYSGDSLVVDPVGNILEDLKEDLVVRTCQLSYPMLQEFRQKFPTWKDADSFELPGVTRQTVEVD